MAMSPDHSHIRDWGVDLPRSRRPAVPMERTPPRLQGLHWEQPEQQPQRIELLRSIERPDIPPVFGTSVPPRGVSGAIRRRAFRHSENDLRHWMMLLLADRVNVVEGAAREHRTAITLVGLGALAAWWLTRPAGGREATDARQSDLPDPLQRRTSR